MPSLRLPLGMRSPRPWASHALGCWAVQADSQRIGVAACDGGLCGKSGVALASEVAIYQGD